jgi:predicted enzyme related to lactoylglutathione lyase
VYRQLAIVLDCADLDRAAAFWCAALGYVTRAVPGPYYALKPADGAGIELVLQRVPEPHTAKSRMHLDLRVRDDLDGEVARLLALGATRATDTPVEEDGWTWHVLRDPDGNEFCVLRPPAKHWERR